MQLAAYGIMFGRLLRHRPAPAVSAALPAVSVVVCARDAAAFLRNNLPFLLGQDYPQYEVLVVNDNSADETESLLQELATQYSRLRVLHLREKKHPGKKHALSEGIAAAHHEWLVLTDADCRPAGTLWLRSLMQQRNAGSELLLGYGAYARRPGLWNKLIRFETLMIAGQYMGLALYKRPYMGVGRNLAYTKKLFEATGGLQRHWEQTSGDDDLFVQDAAQHTSCSTALHPDSFTFSEPKSTPGAWMRQKKRHLGTAGRYPLMLQVILASFQLVNFLFYIFLAISFFILPPVYALGWLAGKWLPAWLFYGSLARKFREKDLIGYIPLLDLIYIFVLPLPAVLSWGEGKEKWT